MSTTGVVLSAMCIDFNELSTLTPVDSSTYRMNDEARRLFEELGSTAVKELAFRDSWVFVGAKGIENKSPFEQVHGH